MARTTSTASSTTDRVALRVGLEATRAAFLDLVDRVAGKRWHQKSPATAWTVAEVLVHLTWALEYLPQEVTRARRGEGMFNFPKWVADPFSYWYIRLTARNSTPESIRQRYSAAIDAAIRALEQVPDSDWERGANFYGEGFHTVADLFQAPARHLAEHTAGM
jgi:DinB superfamily